MAIELTDEALAKIAWEHDSASRRRDGQTWDELATMDILRYLDIARAVRAALTEDAAPWRPDEVVTIPDCLYTDDEVVIQDKAPVVDADPPIFDLSIHDGDHASVYLDAAGVRALERACRRWLAANGAEE